MTRRAEGEGRDVGDGERKSEWVEEGERRGVQEGEEGETH